MPSPSVVVFLVSVLALAAAACGGNGAAPVISEGAIRAALLAQEDAPPEFETPSVNVLTPDMMTDAGAYRLDLCVLESPSAFTPRAAPPWDLVGSVLFPAAAASRNPSSLGEQVVVYTDESGAREDFAYFKGLLASCEDQQPDPNSMYVSMALPTLGDESFAFVSRPKPGSAGAEDQRPDLHQVLIRKRNVIIALEYIQAPATDVATTQALARRALEKFEQAIETQ